MTLIPVSSFDMVAQAADLAERISRTEFVPTPLRNRPDAVLAAMLYGHEIGVGPMESLSKIAVIEGRPALSAELMRAQVLRNGHRLWIEEATTTRVVICGQRRDDDHVFRVAWTADDARKAGLAGRQNWQRYPRAMLQARATAELCRLAFPDALGAARYSTEELEDGFDNGHAELTPAAEPAKTKRRRTPPPPKVIEIPADTPVEAPQSHETRPPLPGEPLEPEQPMSDSQRKRMMAAFRNAGITERGNRLIYASKVVGRTLTSAAELRGTEAGAVIDALEADANPPPHPDDPPPPEPPDDDEPPRPDLFTPGAYDPKLTPPRKDIPEPMNLGQYRTIMQEYKAIGLGESRQDRLDLATLILARPITELSAMSDITTQDGDKILDTLRRIHAGELSLLLNDDAQIVGYE